MIISRTPVRISFVGGGTDLKCFYSQHGGAVVNAAIDKYVYVQVMEKFIPKPETNQFVVEAMKLVGVENVSVVISSDLPGESGLGSSGAVVVGLLNALYKYKGVKVSSERLAEEAYFLESEVLGYPVGKQDQYIAAFGGCRKWKISRAGCMEAEQVAVDSERLHLFYVGKTRQAQSILKEQVANVEKITPHLIAVRDLALGFSPMSFGLALSQGWEHKKQFASGVTTPEIDRLYDIGMTESNGGKLIGAGGGGFLLFHSYFTDALQVELGLPEVKFKISHNGSEIIWM